MTGRVTVVGLGPGDVDLLTDGARAALGRATRRLVRTTRHPAASAFTWDRSFDDVYETEPSLDAVYERVASAVCHEAAEAGDVVYAVPGSPAVAERTVELLRERAAAGEVELHVVPALSFLDLAWARLGVDPLTTGPRVVDGHRFAVEAAGERGPLLVGQCDTRAVLSDVKLAFGDDLPDRVVVLQRLGLADEAVFDVPGVELDRSFEPDHLTTLWIPVGAPPVGREVAAFAELVRTLRERCPWDREQTHRTLTRHLLEETYEVLEAIEALGPTGAEEADDEAVAHLEEELGDLLFQVVFHATIAAESGWFTLADVARGIHDKLVGRHPHVFGGVHAQTPEAQTADDVAATWEQLKAAEKGRASVFDGVPGNLPSLLYAHKILKKAASVGVEPAADELGDLGGRLLSLVVEARAVELDPEAELRAAAGRLRDRARAVERDGA